MNRLETTSTVEFILPIKISCLLVTIIIVNCTSLTSVYMFSCYKRKFYLSKADKNYP